MRITLLAFSCFFTIIVLSQASFQQRSTGGGLEFDRETEEELLKAFTSTTTTTTTTISSISDYSSSMELQDIEETGGDTKIVLMDESAKESMFMKTPNVIYQVGNSDEDLPECEEPSDVCNKIDVYGEPWLEKQCRCSDGKMCSDSLHTDDGHTIVDKHYRYKTCEPVKKLPVCRYFKDVSWTIETYVSSQNVSVHRMNCRCRPNSATFLKRQISRDVNGEMKIISSFACSPQIRTRCESVKEPCRLTTTHKKHQYPSLDEVTTAQLCNCPKGYRCPKKHTDIGNIMKRTFIGDEPVKIYAGHCTPLRHINEPVYTLVH